MLGDATTTAQLTPTDRAQGAAIAWAALVAVAERAPSHVLRALVGLLQATYGRYRRTLQVRNPQVAYPVVAVDGVYGPQSAFAATVLIAQVAESGQMLTSVGYSTTFPSKINTTALVQQNFATATALVDRLSDRTPVLEAIGFQDFGRGIYEAAKRGRTPAEATSNATQFVQATAQQTSSATTSTTVVSTRSTSAGYVQDVTESTQVPSTSPPVIPARTTSAGSQVVPTGAPVEAPREIVRTMEPESIVGRRLKSFNRPAVIIPVSLVSFFLLVWGIKRWKQRGGR